MSSSSVLSVWGITDGSAGMVNPIRGIAEAAGLQVEMKTCRRRKPFAWLPAGWNLGVLSQLTADSDPLQPPWPDMLFSCGRRSVALALAVKKASAGRCFCVHLTGPRVAPSRFDLVIAPEHDGLSGPQVIATEFALHHITDEKLAAAKAHFAPQFVGYAAPVVSVLIGGSTNRYRMTQEATLQLIVQVQSLLRDHHASVLMTVSRRTDATCRAMLRDAFANHQQVYFFDGQGENPYFALLAYADWLMVTDDSVNMMSEAAYTRKPLYILPLLGHQGTKPVRFAQKLLSLGIARYYDGKLTRWDYDLPDERAQIAQALMQRFAAFKASR